MKQLKTKDRVVLAIWTIKQFDKNVYSQRLGIKYLK